MSNPGQERGTRARSHRHKAAKNRPALTEEGCRVFWKSLRDDYPTVSLNEVREVSRKVHEGTHSDTDVIALLLIRAIDEAMGQ